MLPVGAIRRSATGKHIISRSPLLCEFSVFVQVELGFEPYFIFFVFMFIFYFITTHRATSRDRLSSVFRQNFINTFMCDMFFSCIILRY